MGLIQWIKDALAVWDRRSGQWIDGSKADRDQKAVEDKQMIEGREERFRRLRAKD